MKGQKINRKHGSLSPEHILRELKELREAMDAMKEWDDSSYTVEEGKPTFNWTSAIASLDEIITFIKGGLGG